MGAKTKGRCIAFIAGMALGAMANANPTGMEVVHGQATATNPNPNTLNITNSPNAIINWQGFSIGAGETTRFIQQSANSAVLNRVVGNDLSRIMGALRSNGRVFLINPHGIVVGPQGVIDTAGFIASTLNISNENFLKGDYRFEMGPEGAGAITIEEAVGGNVKEAHNGSIYLIAPDIENRGILSTENGNLVLAAGEKVTLAGLDHPDVRFELQAPENQVVNLGRIETGNGAVGIFAGTLRHSGEIKANGVKVGENGAIQLIARSELRIAEGSSINADGPTGGDVHLESLESTTQVAGEVTARGSESKGGEIRILGEHVELEDPARVDASGRTGGGEVLIGGDYRGKNPEIHNAVTTQIGPNAVINADAIDNGDGGRVIVWADDTTLAYGRISVRGGGSGGNGGFVETSGKRYLDIGESAPDISAPNGRGGTWLLDPEEITIGAIPPGGGSFLHVATLIAALEAGGTVEVQTSGTTAGSGDINVNAAIHKGAGGEATLLLRAHNDINLNGPVLSSSNQLHLGLFADNDNSWSGQINIAADIDTNGGWVSMHSRRDAVNWHSGTIKAADVWVSTQHFELSSPADKRLDGATLSMTAGGAPKFIFWSGGDIVLDNNALLENALGIFLIATDGRIRTTTGGTPGRLRNRGNIIKEGTPGTAVVEVPLDHIDRDIEVRSGVLRLRGGGTLGGANGGHPTFVTEGTGLIELAGGEFRRVDTGGMGRVWLNGKLRLTGGSLFLPSGHTLHPEPGYRGELEVTSGELFALGNNGAIPQIKGLSSLTVSDGGIYGASTIEADAIDWSGGDFGRDCTGGGCIGGGSLLGELNIATGAPKRLEGWTLTHTGTGAWGDSVTFADGASFNNQGSISFAPGAGAPAGDASVLSMTSSGTLTGPASGRATFGIPVASSGRVEDMGGTLGFDGGFTQTGDAAITVLDGGRIEGNLRIGGGRLSGSGAVAGSIENVGGNLQPGGHLAIGTLTVEGAFTQGANGRIEAEIDAGGVDRVEVRGSASLDGTLIVETLGTYETAIGDRLSPLGYASRTGSFDTLSGGFGDEINGIYDATQLTLEITGSNGALTWSGLGAPGDWLDQLNWTGGAVPGPGDDVELGVMLELIETGPISVQRLRSSADLTIDGFASLTLGGYSTIDGLLSVSGGGTLDGPGDIEANGGLALDGGNLSGAQGTRLVARGSSTLTGEWAVTRRTLENEGIMNWASSGGPGAPKLDAELINRTGGRLESTGNGSLPGSGRIINEGLWRSDQGSGNRLNIYLPVRNSSGATLESLSGQLSMGEGGSSAGRWTIAPEGRLIFDKTIQILPSATIEGNASGIGSLYANHGSTLNLQTDLRLSAPTNRYIRSKLENVTGTGSLILEGGDYETDPNGTVKLYSAVYLEGTYRSTGTLKTTGVTRVDDDFNLIETKWRHEGLLEFKDDDLDLFGAVLENAGHIIVKNDDGRLKLDGSSLLHNLPGATIYVDDLDDNLYGDGRVLNDGTITWEGDSLLAKVENRGTINWNRWARTIGTLDNIGGTLNWNSRNSSGKIESLNNNGGTLKLADNKKLTLNSSAINGLIETGNGAILSFGDVNLSESASLTGPGSYQFSQGFSVSGAGAEIATGTTIDITDQAITGPGALTNRGRINAGGTSSVESGLLVDSGGELWVDIGGLSSGSLENRGNIFLTSTGGAGESRIEVGDGLLVNSGAITALPGAGGARRILADINLQPGGTVDATSATLLLGSGAADGTTRLIIDGRTLGGNGDVLGDLYNRSGTVSPGASPGTLTVSGNYIQGPNGTLNMELGGTTTAGGDYDLLAITGSATLDGNLAITHWPPYTGTPEGSFGIITYANCIGNFSTLSPPTGHGYSGTVGSATYTLASLGASAPPSTFTPALDQDILGGTGALGRITGSENSDTLALIEALPPTAAGGEEDDGKRRYEEPHELLRAKDEAEVAAAYVCL